MIWFLAAVVFLWRMWQYNSEPFGRLCFLARYYIQADVDHVQILWPLSTSYDLIRFHNRDTSSKYHAIPSMDSVICRLGRAGSGSFQRIFRPSSLCFGRLWIRSCSCFDRMSRIWTRGISAIRYNGKAISRVTYCRSEPGEMTPRRQKEGKDDRVQALLLIPYHRR